MVEKDALENSEFRGIKPIANKKTHFLFDPDLGNVDLASHSSADIGEGTAASKASRQVLVHT